MVENGQNWLTIQICHILYAYEAKKNPGTEPKTCGKGPKLGFEHVLTSKTSHCVHGIPLCNYEANPRYCTFANSWSTPCREHLTCLYLCTVLLLRLVHET